MQRAARIEHLQSAASDLTSPVAEVLESLRDALADAPMSAGEPLAVSIRTCARTVSTSAWSQFDGADATARDLSSTADAVDYAQRLGLKLTHIARSLDQLIDSDLPCIVLLKNGASRVLVGLDVGLALVLQPDGEQTMAREQLEAEMTGSVFLVGTVSELPDSETQSEVGLAATVWRELVAHHRRTLCELALVAFVSNMLVFAVPMFSMSVYDRVIPHMSMESLWALSIGIAIALAADLGLRYVRMKLSDAAALTVSVCLLEKLYRKILRARLGRLKVSSGSVAQAARELEAMCHLLPALAVSVLVDLPWFVLALCVLYSVAGTVVIAPLMGVAALALVHYVAHANAHREAAMPRYAARMTAVLLETTSQLETVKAVNAGPTFRRRWDRLVDEAAEASHAIRLSHQMNGQFAAVIGQAVTVLVLVIGVLEIKANTMSVGALASATLLVGRMIAPSAQLVALLHRLHETSKSTKPVEDLLKAEADPNADAAIPVMRLGGALEANAVTFQHVGADKPILQGVTLRIEPGERVGLIGRAGSGKSTLLRLLSGLDHPTGGCITLGGFNLAHIPADDIRAHMSILKQDTSLFDDTILANLCVGLPMQDKASLQQALAITGVGDLVAQMSKGFDTPVGPRGERLSGGERQAVALARALNASPKMLILDEPTAAMDTAHELAVVRKMEPWLAGRTLIVATHRTPMLSLCDRLIWLDAGRIVADGPKAKVLASINAAAAAAA